MAARRSADAVAHQHEPGEESGNDSGNQPSHSSGNSATNGSGTPPDTLRTQRTPRWSPRVRSGLLAAMLVLLAAGLVAVVLLGRQVRADSQQDEERLQALDTARQFTVNFTTLDYRKPEENIKAVKSLAAGKFRKEYVKSESVTKNLVKSFKTVSKPKLHDAGVVEYDHDSARVIVLSDANQTDAKNSKPQPKTYRLQLDLRQIGGNWRIVEVKYL